VTLSSIITPLAFVRVLPGEPLPPSADAFHARENPALANVMPFSDTRIFQVNFANEKFSPLGANG
jgi:hypothetical protein